MTQIRYVGKTRRLVFDYFMHEGDVREVTEKQAQMLAGDADFKIAGAAVQAVEAIQPVEKTEVSVPFVHVVEAVQPVSATVTVTPADSVTFVQAGEPEKIKKPRGRKKS